MAGKTWLWLHLVAVSAISAQRPAPLSEGPTPRQFAGSTAGCNSCHAFSSTASAFRMFDNAWSRSAFGVTAEAWRATVGRLELPPAVSRTPVPPRDYYREALGRHRGDSARALQEMASVYTGLVALRSGADTPSPVRGVGEWLAGRSFGTPKPAGMARVRQVQVAMLIASGGSVEVDGVWSPDWQRLADELVGSLPAKSRSPESAEFVAAVLSEARLRVVRAAAAGQPLPVLSQLQAPPVIEIDATVTGDGGATVNATISVDGRPIASVSSPETLSWIGIVLSSLSARAIIHRGDELPSDAWLDAVDDFGPRRIRLAPSSPTRTRAGAVGALERLSTAWDPARTTVLSALPEFSTVDSTTVALRRMGSDPGEARMWFDLGRQAREVAVQSGANYRRADKETLIKELATGTNDVVVLVGHYADGGFRLPTGEVLSLGELAAMRRQTRPGRTVVLLSCHAGVTSGNLVPASPSELLLANSLAGAVVAPYRAVSASKAVSLLRALLNARVPPGDLDWGESYRILVFNIPIGRSHGYAA